MSAGTHVPRKKRWGHEAKYTLGGAKSACTVKFEPIDEQPEVDFTSLEDANAGEEVVQYGLRKLGAKIELMIPKEGEPPCPVLDQLRAAAQDPDARVGPLVVTDPPECAMTIPSCIVKRTGWTGDKGGPLSVSYELKKAAGEPTINVG